MSLVAPSVVDRAHECRERHRSAIIEHYAGSKNPAGAKVEYINAEATAVAAAPEFDDVVATNSIVALLDPNAPTPIRLVARITAIEAHELWSAAGRQHPGYVISFVDPAGRCIATPLVFSAPLIAAADRAFQAGYTLEVVGFAMGLPHKNRSVPVFVPLAIRPLQTACAAIAATEEELAEAHRLIREHRHEMLEWIISELRRSHGVVSDGLPPEFGIAETAAVLQALSFGQLSNANPRLHVLLIGLPASGKKLIAAIVKALEPIALPAQASSLTRAGLAAGASRRNGRFVAEPGLLVRAHLGAVVIEDLHGVRPAQRDQIFAVLAEAMEDGRIHLSNAAARGFHAQTAVYFDLNRRSQIKADSRLLEGGPRAMLADIGMPLHVVTRIDAIIELSGTAEDALTCAVAMLKERG